MNKFTKVVSNKTHASTGSLMFRQVALSMVHLAMLRTCMNVTAAQALTQLNQFCK